MSDSTGGSQEPPEDLGAAQRSPTPSEPLPGQPDADFHRVRQRRAAMQARDAALAAVAANTSRRFAAIARRTIIELAAEDHGEGFTTDDVWHRIEEKGGLGDDDTDPRALGAVVRRLSFEHAIIQTGNYRQSVRRHLTPIVVWVAGPKLDQAIEELDQ